MALVQSLVLRPRVLDLQLPVVRRLVVEDLVARVVAVRRKAERQQVGGVAVALQPRYLK